MTTKKVQTKSKTDKLFNALIKGRKLTKDQISSQFGIANPTAHISSLRQEGNNIELTNGRYVLVAA